MCRPCYDRWRYKYGHLRCHWEGCKNHQYDSKGRRMGSGRGKLWYCRLHEVEHLRPSPEIEELNLSRLGANITELEGCWIWGGVSGAYGLFRPEGANKVDWLAHRVLWNLLMGGHKPKLELDHCFCAKRPGCVNPAHLEPVTRGENEARKRKPKHINWAAAEAPAVVAFAERFGLPLPLKTS